MDDKDNFSFDKETPKAPSSTPEAPAGKKPSSPPSRVLLLGLLLVVLGAAAYFYSMEMMAPEEVAVPAGVTKQLIPPPPPAPAADAASSTNQQPTARELAPPAPAATGDSSPATASAPSAEGAAPAQQSPQLAEKGVLKEVPAEPPPAPVEAAATSSAPAPVAAEQSAAAAASKVGSAETAAAEPTPEPATAAVKTPSQAAASRPARGAYTLLAGAYLSPELLKSATVKVKKLGYQPRTRRDAKVVEMTRVRIGAYAPEEALVKLAEVKRFAPDAFTLPEGNQVVVYAASHFNPASHQAFAESLRKAGIAFEEEKVQRKLPLTELSFGEFADREAAEAAAAKARKAGLEIIVFKRP